MKGLLFVLAAILSVHGGYTSGTTSCERCNGHLSEFARFIEAVEKETLLRKLSEVCSSISDSPVCERINSADSILLNKALQIMRGGHGCELLDMCGSEAEAVVIELGEQFTSILTSVQQPQADARCELCEFMVKEIDYLLKNNKTLAEIKAGLEEFCDALSLKEKLLCKAAVPVIMKALEDGIDPEHACEAVKMCPNNTDISLALRGLPCEGCKKFVDFVDRQLYTHLDWMKNFGDELCHRFPPDTDKACLDFVDNHLEESLSKILNTTLSPTHVCTSYIHLCRKL